MKEAIVKTVLDSFTEEQRHMLYYTIGQILENGKNCLEPRLYNTSHDYRMQMIYNSLNTIQKKCATYLIDLATTEYYECIRWKIVDKEERYELG